MSSYFGIYIKLSPFAIRVIEIVMSNLLQLLSDGDFHSGVALGRALGISRSAVWKKLKSLEALGLQLDSVKGKGYRLHPGVELLDQQQIVQDLELQAGESVVVNTCIETISTNDAVREVEVNDSSVCAVCLAEFQSGGRGRRGRAWKNPFGSTISLSVRWPYRAGMASLEGLSLVVGLCVLEVLEAFGASNLKLKWPNDVLWQSGGGLQKLSGILLEIYGDPSGDCEVIIGIGVNVALSAQHLSSIDQPAVDMQRVCGRLISRNKIASAMISALCKTLNEFESSGFKRFQKAWELRDAYAGKTVFMDAAGAAVSGIVCGVNEYGGLLLQTQSGVVVFNGGEVSLKVTDKK